MLPCVIEIPDRGKPSSDTEFSVSPFPSRVSGGSSLATGVSRWLTIVKTECRKARQIQLLICRASGTLCGVMILYPRLTPGAKELPPLTRLGNVSDPISFKVSLSAG